MNNSIEERKEEVIKKKVMKKIDKDIEEEHMKVENPWVVAVKKTRLENPDISYKEALILTKTTYISKEQKKIIKKTKKSKKEEEDA